MMWICSYSVGKLRSQPTLEEHHFTFTSEFFQLSYAIFLKYLLTIHMTYCMRPCLQCSCAQYIHCGVPAVVGCSHRILVWGKYQFAFMVDKLLRFWDRLFQHNTSDPESSSMFYVIVVPWLSRVYVICTLHTCSFMYLPSGIHKTARRV